MFIHQIGEGVIKILVSLSLFLPFIIGSGYTMPPLTPKIFFFQGVVLIMLGVYVCLLILDWQRFRPRMNSLTVAVLVWGASLLLSTVGGVDWHRSLWSTSMRMTGIVFIAHCIAFYIIVSSVIRRPADWQWFFRLWSGVGLVAVLVALVLEAGNPAVLYQQAENAIRASSVLGNPAFFGGFAMTLVFFGYLAFLQEKQKKWMWFALGTVVFALFGVLVSGTRGAFLGLACGLGFAFFLLFAYWVKQHGKGRPLDKTQGKEAMQRLAFLFLPILIFGGISIFFLAKESLRIVEVPAVERFVGIGAGITLHTRVLAWEAGIKAWEEHPLLGWGPNNFAYAFNAYYPPEILQYGVIETWFDVAHSVLFETLATQGFLGIASYIGMFGAAGFFLWQGYRKKRVDIYFVSISGGFLVAHFVFSAFLFEIPTSYFSLFFFLAFLSTKVQPSLELSEAVKSSKKAVLAILGAGILIFPLLVVYALSAAIDQTLVKARQVASQDSPDALQWYAKAMRLPSPYARSAKIAFLDEMFSSFLRVAGKGDAQEARKLFLFVEKELRQLRAQEPLEIQHNLLLGRLYVQGAELFPEQKMLAKAEHEFKDALLKSPDRQQFQYELGLVQFQLGKPKEALSLLKGIRAGNPSIQKGWSLLVCAYPPSESAKKAMESVLTSDKFDDEEQIIVQKILDPC